jgi:hypothetical protein
MLKKIASAGMLTAAIGGVLLTAAPAQADEYWNWKEESKVKVGNFTQVCRSIGVNEAKVDQDNKAYKNHGKVDQDNDSRVAQENKGCSNVALINH